MLMSLSPSNNSVIPPNSGFLSSEEDSNNTQVSEVINEVVVKP